jgi:hypothetical protein
MSPTARGADGDVGIDGETGERRGVEREGQAVMASYEREPIQSRGVDRRVLEFGKGQRRFVERGEQGRLGKRCTQIGDDPFSAATLGEVVVNQCDPNVGVRTHRVP